MTQAPLWTLNEADDLDDDDDTTQPCPACGARLWSVDTHLECDNEECDDTNWYIVVNGKLKKIAPAF